MQDLTFNAWCRLAGYETRHAYTCEGVGDDCPSANVGHFYNDQHAQANGWNVDGLPICPECQTSWRGELNVSLDWLEYADYLEGDF